MPPEIDHQSRFGALALVALAALLVPALGQAGLDLTGLTGLIETLVSLLQSVLDLLSGFPGGSA